MIKTVEEGRENYKGMARAHRRTLAEGGVKAPNGDNRTHYLLQVTRSKMKLSCMAMVLALTTAEIAQIERELDEEERSVEDEKPYGFCG